MRILEKREFPDLATLYLAQPRQGPGRLIEFVDTLEPGIPKSLKWVMMVSTQFGCPVGCRMCDAGALGYQGNLDAGEILDQLRYIVGRNPALDIGRHPKVKIHFARMGEPSLNPQVLEALALLAREFPFPGILPSLSTVAPKSPAITPFFERLLELKEALYGGGRFQLQFSLHSTDERRRREIVPVRTWSLEEIAAYGMRFVKPGDRKITLNFALEDGGPVDPKRVAEAFAPEKFLVKITPINPTQTASRRGIPAPWHEVPASILDCKTRLETAGFAVIVSPSLPEELAAATSCGQLWSEALRDGAGVMLGNRDREGASYVTAGNLKDKSEAWMRGLKSHQRRAFPLHPGKAGLLVVDMQELFLDPRSRAYLPQARAILPKVRGLVEAFRRARRPVYFTFHAHEDPAQDGGLMTSWWRKVCLAGTPEARISPILGADPGNAFRKCRYNAFSNPLLEAALRRDGIAEIVVAGVATNLCVESTIRDAFDRGFGTFVVADATAARTEELHLSSLKNLAHGFSTLLVSTDLLEALGAGKGP